jgi:hypothetical protein
VDAFCRAGWIHWLKVDPLSLRFGAMGRQEEKLKL